MITTINDYDQFINALDTNSMIVLDFQSKSCMPCRQLSPVIEELATKYNGNLQFFNIDVIDFPEIANKYGIRSIPTILLVKDKIVKKYIVGLQSKLVIEKSINKYL